MNIAFVVTLMIAPATTTQTCRAIPHADELWAKRDMRWLIVGEQHGTNETPALFVDLVCLAARHRRVLVAVEQPVSEQAAINAYIGSNGDKAAIIKFLTSKIWTNTFKDGRSSEAQFRMFESLRQLRRAGRIRGVIAFQPIASSGAANHEELMANDLKRRSPPSTVVIALVGNVHAMKTSISLFGPSYMPMASYLSKNSTVTLDAVTNGGTQWACVSPTTCGVQSFGPGFPNRTRAVSLAPRNTESFSGILYVGAPATASLPQKPR